MCGRFALTLPTDAVAEWFGAEIRVSFERARYNISPSQQIPVVVEYEGTRHLSEMRWGFIPHWFKNPSDGSLLINARSETIHEKPAFRSAFAKRRCLIPASGFYEWHREKGVGKEPYFIQAKSGAPMAFGAIWQAWTNPVDQARWVTVAIATTAARKTIADVHHREPVMLEQDDFEPWLRGTPNEAQALTQAEHGGEIAAFRVGKEVNSARHDHPDLMKPLDGEEMGQA